MRTRFDSAVGLAVQRLWSILLAAFSIQLAPGPAPAQEGALRGFDAYVEAAMKEWKVPGLAVAVVKDDRLIHARGYGVKEVGRPDPVDEHTLFAVGSTSKAFTTAALGMLVDEGKLDWDDQVVEGLSGFRLHDPYVTLEMRIRDLVTHRSGLSRADRLWYVGYPREEVLRRIRFHEPTWSFRTHYGYQNIMFLAAGQIIPEVTGTSWDDFVDRRIFTPLGMERSNTSVTALEGDANVATPHMLVEGEPVSIRYRNIDNVGPAGSINSSTAEMARWVRLHLGGGVFEGRRLLKEETVAEIHSPQTVMPIDEDIRELYPTTHFRAYGFGWSLQDHRGRKLVQHGGGIDGMRAYVAMIPEEGIGIVLLSNRGGQNMVIGLAFRALDQLLGAPERDWAAAFLAQAEEARAQREERERKLREARVAGTSPSVSLDAYTGTYADSLYGPAEVTREGGGLVLRLGTKYVGDLEHWHLDVFRAVWRDRRLDPKFATFVVGPDGRVTELQLPLESDIPVPVRFARAARTGESGSK